MTSILKTTRSLDKPTSSKNNGSRLASNKNNNNEPALRKNNGNSEIDRFGVNRNSMEYAKKSENLSKSGKLFKSGKSKSEKTFKFWNLAKLEKKLSKSRNSTNFDVMKAGPNFLTPNARTTFNCLRLVFIEAVILWHFNLIYHILIETDILGYAIGRILS